MTEQEFQIGETVQLHDHSNFPIGGWLHGELAIVCGGSYSEQTLIVKLKNKLLRNAVKQDASTVAGTVVVNFVNVTRC